jgi:hypothetical protein
VRTASNQRSWAQRRDTQKQGRLQTDHAVTFSNATDSIATLDALVTPKWRHAVFVRMNFASINRGKGHEENIFGMRDLVGLVCDPWSDEHDGISG